MGERVLISEEKWDLESFELIAMEAEEDKERKEDEEGEKRLD
jgi:hypothetical protein